MNTNKNVQLGKEVIRKQLSSNRLANVLYPSASLWLKIDREFLEKLNQLKRQSFSANEREMVIQFAVAQCIDTVLELNQYLQITDKDRSQLETIYRRTWKLIENSVNVESTLRMEHFPAIQVWISQLYPSSLAKSLSDYPKLNAVCCSDYSAELQMDILGLDLETLKEPVLDIGCGHSGQLVKYLQKNRIEVQGFDRLVEKETRTVQSGDWFTFDYTQRTWGTIVSHMAFSNHYRYAITYDRNLRKNLELVYLRMLESLALGGCFAYAPGESELESLVDPNQYSIERFKIVENLQTVYIKKILK